MKKDDRRRMEIRAKIVNELFELSNELPAHNPESPDDNSEVNGMFIAIISTGFVIWFNGKPDSNLIVLLGAFGAFIGCLMIIFGQISFAAKLKYFSNRVVDSALVIWKKILRK